MHYYTYIILYRSKNALLIIPDDVNVVRRIKYSFSITYLYYYYFFLIGSFGYLINSEKYFNIFFINIL